MSDSAVAFQAEPQTSSEIAPAESPPEILPLPTSGEIATTSANPAVEESRTAIERATALPPALRERLMTLASQCAADEPVSLMKVLAAVEQSLPDYLRTQPAATQPVHPAGEAFFSGAAGELTDSEAETLAQQQLQRAGLLRGQKVRVAG